MAGLNKSKVAVVTGANGGVGFALCQRLLKTFIGMKLCLCCCNKYKAETAANVLRAAHPESEIYVILLDTSSVKSVKQAAEEIRSKCDHVDHLYLNAGGLKVIGVDWAYLFKNFFTSKIFVMLMTGEGLLLHEDDETDDGLNQVFETNLFGHYLLVKELIGVLEATMELNQCPAQVIWTSSRNGVHYNFSLDDIQHKYGKEPYSSSKYAIKMASVGLNERLNSKMRLCIDSMTTSPENGSLAQHWLCEQDPSSLSPNAFFLSCCNCFGKPYVRQEKMEISTKDALNLLTQMDHLNESMTL